jgi:hypothetical protein
MPLEIHEEVTMKTLNASQSLADGASASRFESVRALAFSLDDWTSKLT